MFCNNWFILLQNRVNTNMIAVNHANWTKSRNSSVLNIIFLCVKSYLVEEVLVKRGLKKDVKIV